MSKLIVNGPVPEGKLIAVQVNADPGWRAFQDGRAVEIETDRLGFMVLHASPAMPAQIELQYRGTMEQRVLALMSAVAWLGSCLLTYVLWRQRQSSVSS
jgi:uncharacterized membrane protein YfhO